MQFDLFGKKVVSGEFNFGMPYMGSKKPSCGSNFNSDILACIYDVLGVDDFVFVDLFGGGGSMSLLANFYGHKTFYNELDSGVSSLFKHVCDGNEVYPYWISRVDFFKLKDQHDWFGGFVKVVYSFGVNLKEYFIHVDNEVGAKLGHDFIISLDDGFVDGIKDSVVRGLVCDELKNDMSTLVDASWDERREWLLNLYRIVMFKLYDKEKIREICNKENRKDLRYIKQIYKNKLDEYLYLEGLNRLDELNYMKDRTEFRRSNVLNHIQSLNNLELINVSNKSYEDVIIPDGSVVYCDPPYKDKAKYNSNDSVFDYDKFYDYCRDADYPVFISEYSMPDDFILVDSWDKQMLFNKGSVFNKPVKNYEKLFWNGVIL
jgi:DNA adenine methylase